MKNLIFTVIAVVSILFASCKKEVTPPAADHVKSPYQILAIGADTSKSTTMFARAETVGLVVAEDDKLKAELIAYNGAGVYTLQVTSKVNCQGIIRWGWDGLTIDSITPGSDVIPANGVVTFTLYGDHKVGRIKLKMESDCGNSSTLIINITAAILPINFIENTAKYDQKTGKTIITFTIDDPAQIDWLLIRRNVAGEWVQAALVACDHVTKDYIIKL